ncbi:MAG TPA: RNA-binding transcriptional accessory protein [Mollicutes bacterium]|nr:RNA-binding transcriptional accessory protein [Mollicutes bacterium]
MNEGIIRQIGIDLNVKEIQIQNTLKLLSEGNTIPFIARYRKEATGNLDEEQIRQISDVYDYQVNLSKRKEDVIRLIDEKGLMTDELRQKIMQASKLVEVEDIYRPFKEKRKTKATDAINNGLEPLAKIIMSFPDKLDIAKFLNDKVKTEEKALEGAKYIIAEWISDNAYYRKWIRSYYFKNGILVSKIKKQAEDESKIYEMYYDYQEAVKDIKPHRVLALNRGEKEKVLTVNIEVDTNDILSFLESKIIKNKESISCDHVIEAIKDSFKRLISPSIEREVRSELTDVASDSAIMVFSKNLEKLLLQPPMKDKTVLGFDPAYRTGCKLAVVDCTGKKLDVSVIYPHEPRNEYEKSKKHILDLIDKYNIDIIAIGNGTASRESEAFIADTIKDAKRKVEYIIVSEAGASVYSASPLAIEEFPNLQVEERSAISIARRLQDPLSELVKIESKSIGVGQYQHDVAQNKLKESLDFIVSKVVNQVGVNINTASSSLLNYVSGLSNKTISKIIEYRNTFGKIKSRDELKSNKILTPKTYEQAIGFLRIVDGSNLLDKTSIHPESYNVTKKLLKTIDMEISDIGIDKLIDKLNSIDIEKYADMLDTDIYTLEDIIKSLKQPNRDLRDDFEKPLLRSDVLKIEDLKIGMKLQGTVRNVVDFGVFIDIGLKNDGLAHISKLSKDYIRHPLEILNVGDIVECYVDEIHLDKKKVSLSMLEPVNN